uniref:DUF2179 domain-containing protein n=1 Tax=Angiostrongylus cantonensis TaxID=6313 RepID=A0A0K0D7T6_ANGCA
MEGNVGAIVAAVSKASNREAIVIGKPHRPVFDYVKKKWHIDETRTMMICSRFDDVFNVQAEFTGRVCVLSRCPILRDRRTREGYIVHFS